MHKLRLLLIIPFVVLFSSLQAQDLHYSQFTLSPHTLNPSLTGAFEGTFRVGGIYRDQWGSVLENQFVTPSVYVDAPIYAVGDKSWVGIGAGLVYDKAGELSLATTKYNVGLAFHQSLTNTGNTVLSVGAQIGQSQKSLKTDQAETSTSLGGGTLGLDNVIQNKNWLDLSAGVSLNTVLSKEINFNLGVSAFNLSGADVSLLDNTDEFATQTRMAFHGQLNYMLNEKWMLSPAFLYQTISSAQEVNVQALAGYYFDLEKTTKINFGMGVRTGDAAEAIVGLEYKNLKVGIAYDFNTSALNTVSAGQGGFEIGVGYIGKIFKTPIVKPVIFCPRF